MQAALYGVGRRSDRHHRDHSYKLNVRNVCLSGGRCRHRRDGLAGMAESADD
jgi:hypothetical protein